MTTPPYELQTEAETVRTPTRLLVLQEDRRPTVDLHDDEMVMTFPHLVVRELIALSAATLVVVVLSLVFDAPLEELANAAQTPNPSKAPWYFLGLQELLHYYPPFVAGVAIPTMVIIALVVVPYFNINLRRAPLWERDRERRLIILGATTVALCLLFYVLAKHPVWALIGTTLSVAIPMALPGLLGTGNPVLRWLGTRSLAFWIFTWFVIAEVVLTVIGVYFRGPGWSFTLPWVDGVY